MEEKVLFHQGWYFKKNNETFKPVSVPHDWLIWNTKDLYEDSVGTYENYFNYIPLPDTRIQLRFDGVYMDSVFFVNDEKVGEWKYGYSTFTFDITDYLRAGENVLRLVVHYNHPNSRWYSGAGIYRDVWMKPVGKIYLPLDGNYVVIGKAEKDSKFFFVEISTEVAGEFDEKVGCKYSLWQGHKKIQELGEAFCNLNHKECENYIGALANEKMPKIKCTKVNCRALVENPKLWEIAEGNCYELLTELVNQTGEVVDVSRSTIGFKTMEFDCEKGFFLNGKNVKLHGVCEHHDFGCLGAVFNEAAMERKFSTLRKMGVNAIRTSHNMADPKLLEMADRLGFLIVEEAFDMWERTKTTYDYGRFFKEWAERDIESFIRRDRNHPCILMWSIGNEIYDTHADEHGMEITKRLVDYVRIHDPKENAPITIGSNYMPWENARKCADIVKFAGYNYAEKYYEEHHKAHPDWIIYGSETASVVSSRGIYHFPLEKSIMSDDDLQCSALGNSTTSWGAKSLEKCITDDRDATFCLGQFLWSGHDYIGEPTPYHTKNSYFGQIDTAGFEKDAFYVFKSAWVEPETETFVHIFPYWDFNEGQLIDVRAASNAEFVELFVNGKSAGKQHLERKSGRKLLGDWKVPYEKGYIEAVAYDADGNIVAKERKESFLDSKAIVVQANKKELLADGKDLIFLTIQTVDEKGHYVENATDYVEIKVEGAGFLEGTDNGDSTDYDQYKSGVRRLFSGKLLAVIKGHGDPGEIKVTVTGQGLKEADIVLKAYVPNAEQVNEVQTPGISTGIMVQGAKQCEGTWQQDCFAAIAKQDEEDKKRNNIAVRKIELSREGGGLVLSKGCEEMTVRALIFPENAGDKELIWQIVNDAGILVNYATVEEICAEGNIHKAKVTALGDGEFRVRCMSKCGMDYPKVISQIEGKAEGLGSAFVKPYDFVGAGLYAEVIGEISNGNEKGIATAREARSGVVFQNIDFGDFGSDVITIPIFAMDKDDSVMEIWQGKALEEGSELLATLVCTHKRIWNTYQQETVKLSKRIKGISTISFVTYDKVHMKGFIFEKQEKTFSYLKASEADRVYGDSFACREDMVADIGNNVTLEFENMNFGSKGATQIKIWGHTPLETNTIHIQFTEEKGESYRRILNFGGGSDEQIFEIEKLEGKGKVEFIFLPGSKFDFYGFQFL